MSTIAHIRNFAIIAHIDHGKSTLADRLIQKCGALSEREMKAQILDSMDLERERGITIKAQTVRLSWKGLDGEEYCLNLLDTPGHVDFSYEVSRSLAACEGAILVVDAAQGVEAQTMANVYLAIDAGLEIIPVLNKIDLPAAEPERVKREIEQTIGLDVSHTVELSAKTGQGVEELLDKIITVLAPPEGDSKASPKALLIDSWYDPYLGVVALLRIFEGRLEKGMKIKMMASNARYTIDRVGVFTPNPVMIGALEPGEIGFITAGIRTVADTKIGDTITSDIRPALEALPGFAPSQAVVFCGLFPEASAQYDVLKQGLEKLSLNDSSFSYHAENSAALGLGFRCGFLGLLHMEIVIERLQREFNLELISTAPSVIYHINLTDNSVKELHNPAEFPDPVKINFVEEPWIRATVITPEAYLGDVLKLCTERRGKQVSMNYTGGRSVLVYDLPLNEIVFDFYDRLKSATQGYASFDYDVTDYREGKLVKVTILINGDPVDALSFIVHANHAEARGRVVCAKLKELIPRQLFKIAIQAAIGGKIIARETLSALRKDVTAKCYGGDITRKRKLLEKQKRGKKKMRQIGQIDLPQSVFFEALKTQD